MFFIEDFNFEPWHGITNDAELILLRSSEEQAMQRVFFFELWFSLYAKRFARFQRKVDGMRERLSGRRRSYY